MIGKHEIDSHRDNSNRAAACSKNRCDCKRYQSTVTCTCEEPSSSHATVFERRSEREEKGRVTETLWSESGEGSTRAAVASSAGGLTSLLSLAPGSERVLVCICLMYIMMIYKFYQMCSNIIHQ